MAGSSRGTTHEPDQSHTGAKLVLLRAPTAACDLSYRRPLRAPLGLSSLYTEITSYVLLRLYYYYTIIVAARVILFCNVPFTPAAVTFGGLVKKIKTEPVVRVQQTRSTGRRRPTATVEKKN